jgi:hypothetical protein
MKTAIANAAVVEPVSPRFLCIASAPNPRSRATQTRPSVLGGTLSLSEEATSYTSPSDFQAWIDDFGV